MDMPSNPLHIDPEETFAEILDFIQYKFSQMKRRVAVIGLSGGLDSPLPLRSLLNPRDLSLSSFITHQNGTVNLSIANMLLFLRITLKQG